jgi:hypothetical protein
MIKAQIVGSEQAQAALAAKAGKVLNAFARKMQISLGKSRFKETFPLEST